MSRAAVLAGLWLLASAARGAGPAPDIGELEEAGEDTPLPPVLPESYAAAVVDEPRLQRALRGLYALDYPAGEGEAEAFIRADPDNPYG